MNVSRLRGDGLERTRVRPVAAVIRMGAMVPLLAGLAACQSADLSETGSLSSYKDFVASDGLVTKTKYRVDAASLKTVKTVHVIPTTFASNAGLDKLGEPQKKLVATAIDRQLCEALSANYDIVPVSKPADMAVRSVVSKVKATNAVVAGVSTVTSAVAPVPVPRIPIGLGSLAMEAEAFDPKGKQIAGLTWARGANIITNGSRASTAADAFELSGDFAEDFSALLEKSGDPMTSGFELPSMKNVSNSVAYAVTGKPTDPDCAVFGKGSGLGGIAGGALGLPPEWSEKKNETKPIASGTEKGTGKKS
ncbi:DUF3313 domain-containing protein [Ensifer sp.]|uniref:DUF3313 domain-containing protein n=1 Tax=Ensifer sp. TaxID=1872086 RepID=UPI002E1452E6|nr:DUF3313 domain-containing protein [Ensifer sp.]